MMQSFTMSRPARKIGGTTVRSIGHIARLQRLRDNDADFITLPDMLSELHEDEKALTLSMRSMHTLAYSAEQALQAALDFQPKMLVVDVIMADVNGIDLGIQIRKLLPKIKMLCFSGQAATADLLDRARRQGYDFQLLSKPVHPQDLLTMLREADEDELNSESNTP